MASDTVRIVLLGDGGVGKTAITIKQCLNNFVENYDPTIADSYRKQVLVDQKPVMLEVLDTAGQEEYHTLTDQWINVGDAFLVVYSLTERDSFACVNKYIGRIAQVKGIDFDYDEDGNIMARFNPVIDNKQPPIMIVGNKLDLANAGSRQISEVDGQKMAARLQCGFLETSAKTGVNIERAFYTLVRRLREQHDDSRKGKKDPKKSRCTIQ